jgi:hypothetical protein
MPSFGGRSRSSGDVVITMHDEIRKARETLERLDEIEDVFEVENEMRDDYVPLEREPPQPIRVAATRAANTGGTANE